MDLITFLRHFFQAQRCQLKYVTEDELTVTLTKSLDQSLMNRPFYWHYMEKMNKEGQPYTLAFTTNPRKQKKATEMIHFGSPRLQQIFNHLQTYEKYTQLFQRIETYQNTPLYPWLLLNIKITYKGLQSREELFSLGLNLVNGQMKEQMLENIAHMPFKQTISDFCYCMNPLINFKQGYGRMMKVIEQYIESQNHPWIDESIAAFNEEVDLIHYFYTKKDAPESIALEIDRAKKQLLPKIIVDIINGGIFYLTE